jgi:hypothetical protein
MKYIYIPLEGRQTEYLARKILKRNAKKEKISQDSKC